MKKSLLFIPILASISLAACSNIQIIKNDDKVVTKNVAPGDVGYIPHDLDDYGVSTLSDFNSKFCS